METTVNNKLSSEPNTIISNSDKPHIAYMLNPDKVFFNNMDFEIIKRIEEQGAIITQVKLEDINFLIPNEKENSSNPIYQMYIKDQPIKIDGFLSYGYMSELHYKAYTYIIRTLNEMGIPTLHSPEAEVTLNDKYLQVLKYKKGGVPIPSTNMGFSVNAYKNIMNGFYDDYFVLKKLSDYGGDGVIINRNPLNAVNLAAKLLWNQEYCLFQTLVKDCPGKSVRVLCIGGKPAACALYNDKTGNYKSNVNYGFDNYSLDSLMDSPKLNEYFELATKAIKSIDENLTIGGVDILDSKEHGMVVLEVNMWPDMYDTEFSTKVDVFGIFAKEYYNKILRSISLRK